MAPSVLCQLNRPIADHGAQHRVRKQVFPYAETPVAALAPQDKWLTFWHHCTAGQFQDIGLGCRLIAEVRL